MIEKGLKACFNTRHVVQKYKQEKITYTKNMLGMIIINQHINILICKLSYQH